MDRGKIFLQCEKMSRQHIDEKMMKIAGTKS
jgi:hypothetical protein